jgi:hypothetical protein
VKRESASPEETLTDTGQRDGSVRPELSIPHLFVACECSRPSAGSSRHSLFRVDRVVIGRGREREAERRVEGDASLLTLMLPDARISSRHVHLVRTGQDFVLEDLGSHNGTLVNGRRVRRISLCDGDVIELGHTLLSFRAGVRVPIGAPPDFDFAHTKAPVLATLDAALAEQVEALTRLAHTNTSIFLLGESGTGKEVTTRNIHRVSGRNGAFLAVNCGALTPSLFEAQLFGHVRGAFSGAVADAPGILRASDGGTLLLDEVGDLPEPSQVALLRVLQEREVVPVGGVRPIKIDLRIVAATHRPVSELVTQGRFRNDLFARLSAFTFTIPPLRERREDVGLMIAAFAESRVLRLTRAAGRALLRYAWPRNVRELHQALDVATTLANGEAVDVAHLPAEIVQSSNEAPVPLSSAHERVREELLASLARHHGNVSQVARELGKARMQVQRWLRRYGLDARSFR